MGGGLGGRWGLGGQEGKGQGNPWLMCKIKLLNKRKQKKHKKRNFMINLSPRKIKTRLKCTYNG